MRLKDKKAIVTGAGQGIGRAIALKMAQEGADVAIAEMNPAHGDSNPERRSKTREEWHFHVTVDVANLNQVQDMVKQVLSAWGKIDILVNNAGFDRGATLLKVKEEDWDAVLGVHLKGTLQLHPGGR